MSRKAIRYGLLTRAARGDASEIAKVRERLEGFRLRTGLGLLAGTRTAELRSVLDWVEALPVHYGMPSGYELFDLIYPEVIKLAWRDLLQAVVIHRNPDLLRHVLALNRKLLGESGLAHPLNGGGEYALHLLAVWAAKEPTQRDVAFLDTLLAEGAKFDVWDAEGRSPLLAAAARTGSDGELCRVLVSRGAKWLPGGEGSAK